MKPLYLKERWKTWRRNASVLLGDVSFRRNLWILCIVLVLSVVCFYALWCLGVGIKAEVYNRAGSRHPLTFHEYLFSILGAIDPDPDAASVYAIYAAFVRLAGAILIGGILTSFLCSLLDRFSDMTLKGKLVPFLSDHVVVVGYTALTDDIVRMLIGENDGKSGKSANPFVDWFPRFPKRKGRCCSKVLLYTSGDVQSIRDSLGAVLERGVWRRVVYAFGDMDMSDLKMAKAVCQKLSLHTAKAVIVLGDACDPGRGDLKNLAFASVAGGYVRRCRVSSRALDVDRLKNNVYMLTKMLNKLRYSSECMPTPFYVQMDDVPTADLIKRMEYKIGSRAMQKRKPNAKMTQQDLEAIKVKERIRSVDLGSLGVYIRPFSYYEGWARAVWGAPYEETRNIDVKDEGGNVVDMLQYVVNYPLDFRPMDKASYVHLIVAGLSRAGEALVIEAIRICHYPNGENTQITIVDPDPNAEMDFRVHHAAVFHLRDVKINFLCERIQSRKARTLLDTEAKNRNCLLTVAICLRNIESAMLEGLCLPWDLYYAYDPSQSDSANMERIQKRLEYPKHPPRILVYQEHVNGNPEEGESAPPIRYQYLRPFGMQEEGFQMKCMRSFASMYLNAVFFWPFDADGSSFLGPFLDSEYAKLYPDLAAEVREFDGKWREKLAEGRQSEISAEERYNLLKRIISLDNSILDYFRKYAFRRFVMMDPVKEWGNVYVPDSYGTVLRSIGLTAERLPEKKFNPASAESFRSLCEGNEKKFNDACGAAKLQRSLEETEHMRWIADRALMGYRKCREEKGEVRDDGYRYHDAMCPYSELPPKILQVEKNKDALVVKFIPLILALEGFKIVSIKEQEHVKAEGKKEMR